MTISSAERTALLHGAHGDPHSVLGPHEVVVDGARVTRVRAFFPAASAVTVVGSGVRVEMRLSDGGVFEADLTDVDGPFPYQLEVVREGVIARVDDPYRFPPTVDEGQLYLFKQGSLEDAAALLGAHPMTVEGVAGFNLVVWAPNARGIAAVGDFNGWSGAAHMMRRLHDSVFEIFIPGAKSGDAYKLSVVGHGGKRVDKADPAARSSQIRPSNSSVLVGADAHVWTDGAYLAARAQRDPLTQPLATYEVHLPSWRKTADDTMMGYRALAAELVPHLVQHGFNAIELVGLAEHPLDDSWGYQVTGYFAPTSRHGTPEDFKAFVDAMHAANIKVIYDWVPAHFPKDVHGLGTFDGTHLFDHEDPRQGEHLDWGTRIFNYGRAEVKSFLMGSLMHMLEEFHLDGVRVDAVASMLYLDYSRTDWVPNREGGNSNLEAIAFLQDVNARVARRFPGVLKIAEESTSWPRVTLSPSAGGLGFDLKWNMGWMHDTLAFFKRAPAQRARVLDELTNTLLWAYTERFVAALSHDEVVHMKRSLLGKMPGDEWQMHANLRLLLAYMASYPGTKLLFMGAEIAQTSEWDFKNPLPWRDAQNSRSAGVGRLVADLNALYLRERALSELQFSPEGCELRVRDDKNAVVGLARKGAGEEVLFLHNLTERPRRHYRVGVDALGRYAELINTDAAVYGGSGIGNLGGVEAERIPMHGRPYSIEVALPPLATVAFKLDAARAAENPHAAARREAVRRVRPTSRPS